MIEISEDAVSGFPEVEQAFAHVFNGQYKSAHMASNATALEELDIFLSQCLSEILTGMLTDTSRLQELQAAGRVVHTIRDRLSRNINKDI